ncbi:hypothetical protein ACFRMN_10820 [Streptomyces sp. NPDC056835]|uniref:hypothetical protein n=1 Tax=Streptomyces sp. NPDC056835 TaxID=3345956 RepID=UPI0036A1B252
MVRGRVSATLGGLAAAVLVVALPGSAQAAQGVFQDHQPGNVLEALNNPRDNQCYTTGNAEGAVENGTNRFAELYEAPGCRGDVVQTVDPGSAVGWAEFKSVKFTR